MKHSDIIASSDNSTNAKSGKLRHIDHPEDIILQNGSLGAKTVAKILTDTVNVINQKSNDVKITLKVDGSPSLIFGHNPENNKFFVGTKSVFNKISPKILYKNSDISKFYSDKPELNSLLQYALKYLKEICPKTGVFQGDLLFTENTLEQSDFGLTFTPNTLTYVLPDEYSKAKIGIAVHTVYSGKILKDMIAKPFADLKSSKNVWVADVSLDFSKSFLKSKKIENMIKQINDTSDIDVMIDRPSLVELFKIYTNHLIKQGIVLSSAAELISSFAKFYTERKTTEMKSLKSEKAKITKKNKILDDLKFMRVHKKELLNLIKTYMLVIEVKNILFSELNVLNNIETFIKKVSGCEKTFPEGFVITDIKSGNTIKLVDRTGFSRDNFLKQDNK